METTADRLRLARASFPEFADLLSENIIDSLARQLDDGKLDAVVEGAAHQNAPGMFRDVLQLIVRATEDDRRRRNARPGKPDGSANGTGRSATQRARPPVSSRSEQPAPPANTPDQRTAAPVSSQTERNEAKPAERPDAVRPTGDDQQPSVAESLAQRGRPATPPPAEPVSEQIDVGEFTGRIDAFASTGGELQAAEEPDAIALSWTPLSSDRVVVYLVAASALHAPDSLQGAQRLGATIDHTVLVPRDSGPHFTVFAYEGDTVGEAAGSEGRPHAQASLLPEVRDLMAAPYASKVIVRWTRPAGVERVRLCRSQPGQPLPDRFDPALELPVTGDVFEDETAAAGAHYVYRVQTIQARSNVASRGVEVEVDVPLRPRAVLDLRAVTELHDPDLWVSLHYSQPLAGQVTIMQSDRLPVEVSSTRLYPAEQLSALQLGAPVIKEALAISDTERLIPHVPFQVAEQTSRFFTPVTVGGGQFVVGNSVEVHYVAPIRDAEVIERVDYQILRFAWPLGANSVAYEVAPPGTPAGDPKAQQTCHRQEYDELGGIRLTLPDTGARIFVHGVWSSAREVFHGEPGVVDYSGRWVLRYRFASVAGGMRVLEVYSESPLNGIYSKIMHHPARWPTASPQLDGQPEGTKPVVPAAVEHEVPAGQWVAISQPVTFPPGYLRALLQPKDPGDRPILVVDPEPEVNQSGRGLTGSAESIFRSIRGVMSQGGKAAAEQQPVRSIRCVHCLQSFPETQLVVRCPPAGTCASVPDVERAAYEGRVAENKPVYPIDPTSGGRTLRCPGCGTAGSQRVCPLCHGDLPPHWAAQDWFALTFVGAKTTGKTISLTVLQHELRHRVVRSLSRTMEAADEVTAQRTQEFEERLYAKGEMAAGTREAGMNPYARVPMVYDLGLGSTDTPAAIALFDVSGEDMHTVATTEKYAHLLTGSDGLVFLIDPLQIPQVQDRLRGAAPGYFEFPEMADDPARVLRNVVTVIRGELGQLTGKLPVRLCVVVSKLDGLQLASRRNIRGLADYIAPGSVLMRDPYGDDNPPLFLPGDAELQHLEVRALLERLNAIDFLNLLASNFSDYRFFAQSALGHGPIAGRTLSDAGINSYRLSDVVRMFLAEKQW